jgi:hypothetical protein
MNLKTLKTELTEKGIDILSTEATSHIKGGCGSKSHKKSGKSGKSRKTRKSKKSRKGYGYGYGCGCFDTNF